MPVLLATPRLRPFHRDDLHGLVNRDGAQVDEARLAQQAQAGPAFTAGLDARPLGGAGVLPDWPGVGLCWMVLSVEMGEHGLWLTRTVKYFLRDMVRIHGLHRLEAVSVNGDNGRWLEVLGFTSERDGVARQFLPDRSNVVRYEWVKGD